MTQTKTIKRPIEFAAECPLNGRPKTESNERRVTALMLSRSKAVVVVAPERESKTLPVCSSSSAVEQEGRWKAGETLPALSFPRFSLAVARELSCRREGTYDLGRAEPSGSDLQVWWW
ncbi:hypothetical protein CCHR01_18802 [Colletotrichum chrysophilum]|uniref:Uncharacterized protein n=1 Tax=Colletotrichum chrysophilum TaxID=1836956 RepID=A0AAD9E7U2_9PEZI|nr:hypothetical protein CCHR01_18802 [Colletotrichum chrysophilum]